MEIQKKGVLMKYIKTGLEMRKIIATKQQRRRPCLTVKVPGPADISGTIEMYGEGEEIEVRIKKDDLFKILFKGGEL